MRTVIVEDHLMFREVLRKVCAVDLRHEVVGEAADGEQAVAVVARTAPGLVLLDLHLPALDGFGVIEAIGKLPLDPAPRLLVLSSHCDEFTVYRAEELHVHGFVDKNTNSVATLKEAVGAVAAGRTWFSEPFLKLRAARQRDPHSFDKLLTVRERGVLGLVGASLSDPEIGARLSISTETVEKHRSNIRRKLGFGTNAELARYARAHGFTLSERAAGDGALLP